MLQFFWLRNCQYVKMVSYYSDILEGSTWWSICCQLFPCRTPIFFCTREVFVVKMFFTFYFKTCSNRELFASVSYYSLVWGLNVLLPENYLCFSGMVIRYIIMRIPTCLRRKGFIRFLQSFAKYIWNLLGFTENLDF